MPNLFLDCLTKNFVLPPGFCARPQKISSQRNFAGAQATLCPTERPTNRRSAPTPRGTAKCPSRNVGQKAHGVLLLLWEKFVGWVRYSKVGLFFSTFGFFFQVCFFYRKPPWNMKWKTQASTSKWHLFFSFEIKWQRFFYRENPSHFGLIGMSFDIWFTSRSNSTQSWSTNWAGCRHVKQRKQYPNSFGTIFTPQNKRKQIHYKLIKS